jgi:hypothetical protein
MKAFSIIISLVLSLCIVEKCAGQPTSSPDPSVVRVPSNASNLATLNQPNSTSVVTSNVDLPSVTNGANAGKNADESLVRWKKTSPVWSAFWGAFCAAFLGLIAGAIKFWYKRNHLTRKLNIRADSPHGNHFRCEVFNSGLWTVRNAAIYITLRIKKEDTCKPPDGHDAIIRPDHFVSLEGGQLCWSTRLSGAMYPTNADIYAKERKGFSPCAFTAPKDMLMIPCEEGWPRLPNDPLKMRVFLQPKPYTGYLKVVSEDTDAKCYELTINPTDMANPIQIKPIACKECKLRV